MKALAPRPAQYRSEFLTSLMVPASQHEDQYFGPKEGLSALAIMFGTIGLMRLFLVFLGGGLF